MKGFRKPFFNQQIAICTLALFGATAAMAKDATEIYKMLCTPCHGMNGEGKKPMGPPLKGSEFIKTSSDADVKKTIQNGRAGAEKKFKDFPAPMPPQKQLTDAELDALVKYLKDLNREVAPSTPLTAAETPKKPEPPKTISPSLPITPAQSQGVAPSTPLTAAEIPKKPEPPKTISPPLPAAPAQSRCVDCHKNK